MIEDDQAALGLGGQLVEEDAAGFFGLDDLVRIESEAIGGSGGRLGRRRQKRGYQYQGEDSGGSSHEDLATYFFFACLSTSCHQPLTFWTAVSGSSTRGLPRSLSRIRR